MIRAPAARGLLITALAGCLAACAGWSRTLVHVDTANADVAAYAEQYNRSQDRYRVVIRYVDGPAGLLARGGTDADVLVGPGLASGDLVRRLRPLDRLLGPGRLDASAFFPNLLEAGRARGAQIALPLSFRLPVIVVRAGDEAIPSFAVTPEELAARDSAPVSWDAELVYQAAVLYGADFRLLPDGRIGLEQAAVDRAVELARGLIAAGANEYPADPLGEDLTPARPFVQMLLDGRIDFFLTDLQGFVDIPRERRNLLGVRWLGRADRLQPGEDLTYAVIRAGARNPRGARAFLLWLFEATTQMALLEFSHREHLTGFGIAGGLPALIEVARYEMATHYPFLLGRVPTAGELHAPAALNADWDPLREEVVLPWLWAQTRGADQPPLAAAIDAWRQRRPAATEPAVPENPPPLVDTEENGRLRSRQ